MIARRISAELVAARRDRLRQALATAPFDAVLALGVSNVDYATGYRSLGAAVHGAPLLAAVLTGDEVVTAGPVADSAPAFDAGIDEDAYIAHGRFYFESAGGAARPTRLVDQHPDRAAAIAAAVGRVGSGLRIGLDSCPAELRDQLTALLPDTRFVPAGAWLAGVRARKLDGEVELIERAARIVESAILTAIDAARVGDTEADVARVVAVTLVAADFEPRFVVVTSGERSALADAYPTDRRLRAGDLVRFDVGGLFEGYWADLGRTAVVGEPSAKQAGFYAAVLAGEEAQFALARPGVRAAEVFGRAVEAVEGAGGPVPYRRQHCGHGIGLDVYEAPIIRGGEDVALDEGMTFCFETPYYEVGWGGMMVEDALVVTSDGIRLLSDQRRDLQVIPA